MEYVLIAIASVIVGAVSAGLVVAGMVRKRVRALEQQCADEAQQRAAAEERNSRIPELEAQLASRDETLTLRQQENTALQTEVGRLSTKLQEQEKAIKAFWFRLDLDPWGHSIARLIKDLPVDKGGVLKGLLDSALALDKLYIPTRYPDALAELTPAEAYTRTEAETAVNHAQAIIAAVAQEL